MARTKKGPFRVERGGLGDIWADLRPGPDPGFLDGIRALVGSGAHRAAPVKILLQQSGG